jgi:hypothetical protein
LLIQLKINGDPEAAVSGLDRLVYRAYLRTSLGPYIIKDVRCIIITGWQFQAKAECQVPLGMRFQVEQPVAYSYPHVAQAPRKGGISFFPPVFIKGGPGIDHSWDCYAGVKPLGDAIGQKKIPCMRMIYNLIAVGNPVWFFFRAPEMPERFKIAIVHPNLDIPGIQEVALEAVAHTG